MSLEDFSKEWNHFHLTFILWSLWFGIPESSSTQEHQLSRCWHSWKHPESVHRRFLQHCYDCYLVQVANTKSFITIWGKKIGLNIKMKCETTSNWFWKEGTIKSRWRAKDQLLSHRLMTCQSNMTGGNVHAWSPRWWIQFREEDESDKWRTSFFTQRTADSSFWDLVLTEQLSISECFSTAMKAVFKNNRAPKFQCEWRRTEFLFEVLKRFSAMRMSLYHLKLIRWI